MGLTVALAGAASLCAEDMMAAKPADMIEVGTPGFVILSPRELGLNTPPTDLHLLADGRILVVAQREIAFGDGTHWDTYRSAASEQKTICGMVAVGDDGQLYTGIEDNIARIQFDDHAIWHLEPVAPLPPEVRNIVLPEVKMMPDAWYWHCGTSAIVSWRPGTEARLAGQVETADCVFHCGPNVFVSSSSTGELFRIDDGTTTRMSPPDISVRDAVTCAVPFDSASTLVGTLSNGLQLLDWQTHAMRRFAASGVLKTNYRMNDLCAISGGLYAAAIDTVGIVLFDRTGRPLQVLDRVLDHRLARVQKLHYAANGVLWAVLNEGLACFAIPSRLSHFEPLLSSGIHYAHPVRHEGRLWMLTDGRVLRGVYDDTGRLQGFRPDAPRESRTSYLMVADGSLFAASDAGLYVRSGEQWRLIVDGVIEARVGLCATREQGLLYAGRGEIGWLKKTPGGSFTVKRFPEPELGVTYGTNGVQDATGMVWLELGTARVARVDPRGERPIVTIFGPKDGLLAEWVNVFALDGVAHFALGTRHLRFDERTQSFTENFEFARLYPEMAKAASRPARDGLGRTWFSSDGDTYLLEAGANRAPALVPVGFATSEFTMETNGVVWMWAEGHCARYDPSFPEPSVAPLRAVISSVQLGPSGRYVFTPGDTLPPLSFADNSLVFHYAAPANPFGAPVTFEIMLEGNTSQWMPMHGASAARFDGLREGNYVFHVRPLAGAQRGEETKLAFSVQPPWFRTPLAWSLYVAAALVLVAWFVWVIAYLQKREKRRLARLVTERTQELQQSEERYRTLNVQLEQRVNTRTHQLAAANDALVTAKERAETADKAKSAFLASVSHEIRNPMNGVVGICAMLLDSNVGPHEKQFIRVLAGCADQLRSMLDDILDFSRIERGELTLTTSTFELAALVDEAARVMDPLLESCALALPAERLWLAGDSGKVRQIVCNLVSNALKYGQPRRAAIEVRANPDGAQALVRIAVRNTGPMIPLEEQAHLFQSFRRGRTSERIPGTGVGLAVSQRLAAAMGGRLTASSTPELTEFALELRLARSEPPPPAPQAHGAGTRVLAVEDEEYNRIALGHILRRMGFEVDWALDGASALRLARSQPYGLILTDWRLPDTDGGALCRRLLETLADPKPAIIAVTAYSTQEKVEEAKAAGVSAFVSKPVTQEKLERVLRDCIGRTDGAPSAGEPTPGGAPSLSELGCSAEVLAKITSDWRQIRHLLQARDPQSAGRAHKLRSLLYLADQADTAEQVGLLEAAATAQQWEVADRLAHIVNREIEGAETAGV